MRGSVSRVQATLGPRGKAPRAKRACATRDTPAPPTFPGASPALQAARKGLSALRRAAFALREPTRFLPQLQHAPAPVPRTPTPPLANHACASLGTRGRRQSGAKRALLALTRRALGARRASRVQPAHTPRPPPRRIPRNVAPVRDMPSSRPRFNGRIRLTDASAVRGTRTRCTPHPVASPALRGPSRQSCPTTTARAALRPPIRLRPPLQSQCRSHARAAPKGRCHRRAAQARTRVRTSWRRLWRT